MKIKKTYKQRGIRQRIYISFAALLGMLFIFSCIVVYFSVKKQIIHDFNHSVKQSITQTTNFVNSYLYKMKKVSYIIEHNDRIYEIMEKAGNKEDSDTVESVFSQYNDYMFLKDYFSSIGNEYDVSISCYVQDGFSYADEGNIVFNFDADRKWKEYMRDKSSRIIFTNEQLLLPQENKDNSFSYIKMINSKFDYTDLIGAIRVDIPKSVFEEILKNNNLYSNGVTYLVDDNNEIYLSSDIHNGMEYEDEDVYVFEQVTDLDGWKVISKIPKSTTGKLIFYAIVPIVLMFLLVFLLISVVFYRRLLGITKKLRDVTEKLNAAAHGEFLPIEDEVETDEIGGLIINYNKLVKEIDWLIKKRAEDLRIHNFELLVQQINPHFLYNTLTSISYIISTNNADEVKGAINSLAKFYKMRLDNSCSTWSMRKEIDCVDMYVDIQRKCLSQDIQFEVDMDERLLDFVVPKMILQPIVENSIIHGFITDKAEKAKQILIVGYEEDEKIYILVVDNGTGIDEHIIHDLNNEKTTLQGMGIKNCEERIRMFFGKDCNLTIESQKGVGTTVSIEIIKDD